MIFELDRRSHRIVCKALSAPARQIASNSGEDGSVIVGKILEKGLHLVDIRPA